MDPDDDGENDVVEQDGDEQQGLINDDMEAEESSEGEMEGDIMDPENWEEQRLQIYIEGGALAAVRREPSDDEEEDSEAEPAEDAERFDTALPSQHAYLGEGHEVSGRTVLEEDLIQELVIFPHHSVILMPGQTLPITLLMPQHISVVEGLIETSKTFGSLYIKAYHDDDFPSSFKEATVGTTAEIYEYRDARDSNTELGFKIKVKGRQRFKVLSWRQQIDGTRIATVRILKEVILPEPLHAVRLKSRDRFREVVVASEEEEDDAEETKEDEEEGSSPKCQKSSSTLKNSFAELMESLKPSNKAKEQENKPEFTPERKPYLTSKRKHLRTCVYAPPLTPFPNWVYEQYDSYVLAEQVNDKLASLKLYSHTHLSVPKEPVDLSFWVATNLPISNVNRLRLLEMNCCVQRLRCELSLLRRGQSLVCRSCDQVIGRQSDLFSMSAEGPQSAYVNSHGYTHETLTLYKATGMHLRGSASTEYSWFPGYAWTIAECSSCSGHMGWKFTATNKRLVPKKFWGISRQSVRAQMEIDSNLVREPMEGVEQQEALAIM